MTGINHALTGALVAVAINEPLIALPVAFLSHFVIDMLPHFTYETINNRELRRLLQLSDIFISVILLLLLAVVLPTNPWLLTACGLLAMLPDSMYAPYVLWGHESLKNKKSKLYHIRRWHLAIQWSESRGGIIVEAIYFVAIMTLLLQVA